MRQMSPEPGSTLRSGSWIAETTGIFCYPRESRKIWVTRESWGHYLHDLGECAVKHGVPMVLVNFYGNGVGNPELPKMVGQSQLEQGAKVAASRAPRRFRAMYLALAATFVLLAATTLSIWLYSRQKSATALPEEKSIAVLPFENFSPEKDNAFFA